MNVHSVLVRSAIFTSLAAQLYSGTASAATTMPYFGPDQKSCVVNAPKDMVKEDAGYTADENCTKIYVHPPKVGVLEYSPGYFGIETLGCPTYLAEIGKIVAVDPDTQRQRVGWEGEFETYKETLLDLNRNTAAAMSGIAYFDWGSLVTAYQKANPRLEVAQMPIRIGALSIGIQGTAGTPSLGAKSDIGSIQVSGVKFPREGEAPGLDLYESLFRNDTTFIMGQAVGFTMGLSLPAACQMSVGQRPQDSVSATYTYVYPVQTKGLMKISIKPNSIQNEIRGFILSKRNGFNPEELHAVVKEKGIFEIELNPGAFTGVSIEQLSEYKEELMKRSTETLLSALQSNFDRAKASATTVHYWNNYRTECRGAWFWKKCNTIHWITSTTDVNWNKVAETVANHLSGVVSAEASQYKTFYQISTSAMQAKRGNLKWRR